MLRMPKATRVLENYTRPANLPFDPQPALRITALPTPHFMMCFVHVFQFTKFVIRSSDTSLGPVS